MSEIINGIRIEQGVRENVPEPMLDILLSGDEVLISGMPLLVVPAKSELDVTLFEACPHIYDEPVMIRRIFNQRIPTIGHRHISDRFIEESSYPAVQCFTFTEDEIVFGILEALEFSVRSAPITY